MTSDKSYAVEERLNTLWSLQAQVATVAAAGQTINSGTPANIAALTNPVQPGTYAVTGQIIYSPNQASATTATFSWAGSLTNSSMRVLMGPEFRGFSATVGVGAIPGTSTGTFTNMSTGYTTNSPFGTASLFETISISGVMICTVAGTFALQAAVSNGADPIVVEFGTWFELSPQF